MNTVVSNPFLQIPQVTSNFPFIFHLYYYNILNIVNFRKMQIYMEESRFVKCDFCPRRMWIYSGIKPFPPNSVKFSSPPIFPVQYIRILLILERWNYTYMEESRFVKRDLCPRGTWIYGGIEGGSRLMENNERLISGADERTKMTGARYKSIYRCANTRYRHANWYRRVCDYSSTNSGMNSRLPRSLASLSSPREAKSREETT